MSRASIRRRQPTRLVLALTAFSWGMGLAAPASAEAPRRRVAPRPTAKPAKVESGDAPSTVATPVDAPTPVPATAATPAAVAPAAPAAPPVPAPGGGFDFDLMGGEKPPEDPAQHALKLKLDAELEAKVIHRRRMLLSHQAIGFVTLAAMAATLVIGQLNYQDKYGGGDDTKRWIPYHEWLSIATTGLYAATGVTALFAPNPYPKPIKFDSAFVHKGAMLLSTVGMALQIILGPIAAAREGKLDQRDIALAHLVSGYATFGFMAAGLLAYVF